jgi:membrane protein YdbS with pleckstrin-like domain
LEESRRRGKKIIRGGREVGSMRELDKVIEAGEEVVWEGRPKFAPFLGSSFVGTIVMGFIVVFFVMPFAFSFMVGAFAIGGAGAGGFALLGLLLVVLGGIALCLLPVLYTALVYKNMHYAITNRRVIIQRGLIGRDFAIVDFDKIHNAEVNVGVLDKLFGGNSGSIMLWAGRTVSGKHGVREVPDTLQNILAPYDVFKFFKKVSYDVKTDMEYPNQYRPPENPGYGTKYRPEKKK